MLGKSANSTPEQFTVGSRVRHYTENRLGTLVELDSNLIELGYNSTTCKVQWDDDTKPDLQ